MGSIHKSHPFKLLNLLRYSFWILLFSLRRDVVRCGYSMLRPISFTFPFREFIFGAVMSTVNSRNCFPRFEYYMVLLMTRIPNKSPLQSMYLVGLQSSKTFDWHILFFSAFFCFTSCFDIFHVFGFGMELTGMWRGMTIETNTNFCNGIGAACFSATKLLIMEQHKSSQQKCSISIYNQSQL